MKRRTLLLAGASLLAMTAHACAEPVTFFIGSSIISASLAVPGGAAVLGALFPAAGAAAIGGSVLSTALTIGSLAAQFLAPRPKANPNSLKQTSAGAEGPGRYATGRVEIAGQIGFGNTAGYVISKLLLHAFGPMVAVEEVYYDGRAITVDEDGTVSSPPFAKPAGSYLSIQTKVGDGTETAWPDLIADYPALWTADHRVRGIFQSLLRFTNPGTAHPKFQRLLQGGVKEVKYRVRMGAFFDPRDDSTAWTLNGPLQCLHWLRRLPGVTDSLIDFDDIEAVCDEADLSVDTLEGTAPRCTMSGGWQGPLTTDIVLDMLESCGLDIRVNASGKYTFEFIEDYPDAEVSLLSRHIIERSVQTGPDGAKRPNVCKLKYFSPERRYEVSELDLTGAPWARVEAEITAYGEQEYTVELPFCCDKSQAQRIARRLFHMARAEFGMIKTTFAGIACWGLRTADIEIPDVGVDGASVTQRVRLGSVRVNDEDGTCEIPFAVIPDILQTPWNPASDEVAAPPVQAELQYEAELDTPAAPAEFILVEYPNGDEEVRCAFTSVSGATVAEATFRTYTGGLPDAWQSMTEDGLNFAWKSVAQNVLTNGGFDTSASWSNGVEWTYDGTNDEWDAAAGNIQVLSQSQSFSAGVNRRTKFTLRNHSAGAVRVQFQGGTTRNGTDRTANGRYTETLLSNSGNNLFALRKDASFVGSVDDAWLNDPAIAYVPAGTEIDVRVRFFNAQEEGSYHSDILNVASLAIDNTATAAPVLVGGGTNGDFDATVTAPNDLNVAYVKVFAGALPGSGTEYGMLNARPGETLAAVEVNVGLSAGQSINIWAVAYTSDGTASADSNVFSFTEPV